MLGGAAGGPAAAQAAHHDQVEHVAAELGLAAQRQRDVEAVADHQAVEAGRRHADDLVRALVDQQRRVGGQIAAAQLALPEVVAEDHAAGGTRRGIVGGGEEAAAPGPHAERVEVGGADHHAARGPQVASDAREARRPREEVERLLAGLQLVPLRAGQPVPRRGHAHAAVAAGDAHLDDLVGPCHRQAAQAHRVEQLEDRRVGADAEGERGDRDHREADVVAERARRVAQVAGEPIEPADAVHLVDLLADAGEVAQLAAGGVASVGGRHAARDVVGRLDLEIALELASAFAIPAGPGEPSRQPHRVTPRLDAAPG